MELRRRGRQPDDTPLTLPTLPGVDSISIATRYLANGRKQFLELMQHAVLNNDPLACKWWFVYMDLTPAARLHVSLDDVTCASGVEAAALCGMLVSTAMRFGRDVAEMVRAMTHPKVVQAQALSAERIDGPFAEVGFKDRIAFLQGMGTLPVPKGATINMHMSANAVAAAAASNEPTVPSFAQDLGGVPVRRPLALSVADPTLAPLDVSAFADRVLVEDD